MMTSTPFNPVSPQDLARGFSDPRAQAGWASLLDYARQFAGGGLQRLAQSAGVSTPEWSQKLGAALTAPDVSAALGMASPMGAGMKGITAYHGSPHDFNAFDMSKIGTGEGAQAYGHGLYFAESPEVAEQYKRGLATLNAAQVASHKEAISALRQGTTPSARATQDISAARDDFRFFEKREPTDKDLADYLEKGLASGQGRTYQVKINADPDHFLDWDKPLSQQSPKVQEAMAPVLREFGLSNENPDYLAGTHILNRMSEKLSDGASSSPAVTERLRQAGIPGIKYLDQNSRAVADWKVSPVRSGEKAGQWQVTDTGGNPAYFPDEKSAQGFISSLNPKQTSNYVVFDDKTIDIIKKYGLAGVMGGAASQYLPTDGQQQQ